MSTELLFSAVFSGLAPAPRRVRYISSFPGCRVVPVLSAQSSATYIPAGATVTLNLTDPDSLTIDPRGNVVLDAQGDGQLVFIRHPFSNHPDVGLQN